MKNKTVKMILALSALAVCCGAYVGVKTYVSRQEEREAEESEEDDTSETVFEAEADDIKEISFVVDKNEVTFEKKEDVWKKKDEEAFPVDQTSLDDAVSSLTDIVSDRVLEEAENLEQYGLDEPSNTIKITVKASESEDSSEETEENDDIKEAEESETTLRIGDLNESSNQYYVSKGEDRNTVYLVDSGVIEPFTKTLYEYAQKEDFPVIADTSEIEKIAVTGTEDLSYTLEKEEDTGFWYLGEEEKADSAKASSLAAPFGSMAYDSFVNYDCEDPAEYGLDKPYALIEVDYLEEVPQETTEETEEENAEEEAADETTEENASEDAETMEAEDSSDASQDEAEEPEMIEKHLKIAVGNESEDGGRYVCVNDSNQIYTLSSDTLSSYLDKTEADFWDMAVKNVPLTGLENLSIEYQGEKHEVNVSRETSEDEDGETEETTTYLLDGEEVEETNFTTFYNKLNNMTAERRLTEEFESEAEPEMTLIYTTSDGEVKTEYYGYDTNYYAVKVDQKTYLVNKMTIKSMFEACETLLGMTEE